jgi:hypothetical protein
MTLPLGPAKGDPRLPVATQDVPSAGGGLGCRPELWWANRVVLMAS